MAILPHVGVYGSQATSLLISHDLAVIHFMCDDIGVMQQGRLVEQGAADTVLDAPQHDYTRQLLAAVPELGQAAD
ncbi:hypothetical protein [Lautropia dentalis]|uniref:ABC transporter ATP-binding protein n=1 Tax=Lautropia dentalis TaxID=2490857 RepID=UPI0026A060DF